MVTPKLLSENVNKRTRNLNKKFSYVLYSAQPQIISKFTEELKPLTKIKEAAKLVDSYHRKYGNYSQSQRTKFPSGSGEVNADNFCSS